MENLILLHGAAGAASQLQQLKEKLSSDYKVFNPDFPGHGKAEMPLNFSIDFFADFLLEYCRDNGISKASVFGYSMGGYVALRAQWRHKNLFKKIITLGTKFYWDEETAAKEIKKLQPSIISEKLPAFAAALQNLHAPGDWKEVLGKTASMLKELGKENLLNDDALSAIDIPCLVMLGDRDKMVSMDKTLHAYSHLKNAQLAILPSTPHPIEQVDFNLLEFMIRRFLPN